MHGLFTWLSRSEKHACMLVGSAVEVFSKLMASEDKEVVRRVVDYVWEVFKIRKAALKLKGIAVQIRQIQESAAAAVVYTSSFGCNSAKVIYT